MKIRRQRKKLASPTCCRQLIDLSQTACLTYGVARFRERQAVPLNAIAWARFAADGRRSRSSFRTTRSFRLFCIGRSHRGRTRSASKTSWTFSRVLVVLSLSVIAGELRHVSSHLMRDTTQQAGRAHNWPKRRRTISTLSRQPQPEADALFSLASKKPNAAPTRKHGRGSPMMRERFLLALGNVTPTTTVSRS